MTLEDEAELYRRGLEARYVTAAEAVAWADAQIEALPVPPISLFDVSLAGASDPHDIAVMLQPLAGERPLPALLAEQVRMMRHLLQLDPSRARAMAWVARDWVLDAVLPSGKPFDDLLGVAYAFDPEEQGWAGTPEQGTATLIEVLADVQASLPPAG